MGDNVGLDLELNKGLGQRGNYPYAYFGPQKAFPRVKRVARLREAGT